MASYDELYAEFKKLAKRADQRLVRIEKYSEKQKSVLQWAYKKAMFEIHKFHGNSAKRFNIKPKTTNKRELEKQIKAIKNFLEMETSTISQIKAFEKERIKAVNDYFKTDLTVDEWMQLHQSGTYAKIIDKYGFYLAQRAIGKIKEDKEKIKAIRDEARQKHKSIKSVLDKADLGYDEILQDVINDVLKTQGRNIEQLL